MRPRLLQVQINLNPVDADIGDVSTRRHNVLAKLEGGGNAHRLDRRVHAAPTSQFHHLLGRVARLRKCWRSVVCKFHFPGSSNTPAKLGCPVGGSVLICFVQ